MGDDPRDLGGRRREPLPRCPEHALCRLVGVRDLGGLQPDADPGRTGAPRPRASSLASRCDSDLPQQLEAITTEGTRFGTPSSARARSPRHGAVVSGLGHRPPRPAPARRPHLAATRWSRSCWRTAVRAFERETESTKLSLDKAEPGELGTRDPATNGRRLRVGGSTATDVDVGNAAGRCVHHPPPSARGGGPPVGRADCHRHRRRSASLPMSWPTPSTSSLP